ncbi:MAG: pyruvate kinase [Candidatus Abyssobacteria bacterium SURF_17]|uniref:Pyruvate kinase n=1 Tax=Candidatus Abyssobacteria bacterium SURF_17 TaxID=2093361 RepID=A0A419ETG6_9BACT|nr:MAG: pyruvate kinase [Candidatus Abyssubacteria bacterium SURF_17]
MRRTKIVATIGPSSQAEDVLKRMINGGMDVARLNFSHGTHAEHEQNFRTIRRLSDKLGKPVGIIGDLQGPKIRTGELAGGPLSLRKGGDFVITTRKVKGAGNTISTTYRQLHRDVKAGDRILLDDGSIEAHVSKVTGRDIRCRIINGGKLGAHKGINLPGVRISEPSLTRKDKVDVRFAVKLGVDYLAMSFVRRPDDIERLKRMLKRLGADIPVIAKIEKPEALENITAILAGADGIMVARGDLGVEMPPEKVPQIQKDLIAQCIESGKPVITATQMLESMITSARPTRAEASDVANAIYDGTGAVMLSGETAVGEYPVQAVRMMARIADEADAHVGKKQGKVFRHAETIDSFEDAIGQATETTARHLPTRLIVCFTSSGFTAQQVSSYRPKVPIVAATHNREVLPRMSLYWGVQPICIKRVETVDAMIIRVERELLDHRMAHKGDTIIITAGYPLGVRGTTNMMQLVRVGEHRRSATAGRDAGKRG